MGERLFEDVALFKNKKGPAAGNKKSLLIWIYAG